MPIARFPKTAMPSLASFVNVPFKTTPAGLARPTVMLADEPVTTLPKASAIITVTAGEIDWPAVASDGSTLNSSCEGRPGVTLKPVLVAAAKASLVASSA